VKGAQALDRRRAGVLLHPTSLPEPEDQGDFGHAAFRFVDFLADCGFSIWQTLPLGPTHRDGSPYQSLSVHAGNPQLISLDWLRDRGWLKADERAGTPAERSALLEQAYRRLRGARDDQTLAQIYDFATEHATWLEDFALYEALREELGLSPWYEWPEAVRDRDRAALATARKRLAPRLAEIRFQQWVFFQQWEELRSYANERGVLLFGDMPIFVAHDSAEVWARRDYFTVDEHGRAEVIAGVPPDYFSATGQRWGNPLYRWEPMEADGFRWWIERMRTQLDLFDLVRIDHFRGLEACWEIPADAETAIEGSWVPAPGEALLRTLRETFHALPIVAEDLGTITAEVDALREQFAIPGMKVLQFAFGGGADNPYLLHNHEANSVVYTGTHDNDTTLAWYQKLDAEQRSYVDDYLGHPREAMPWPLMRLALASPACYCMLPMQDILCLGDGHRMNMPGTIENNWRWRYRKDQISKNLRPRLRHLLALYGRL
jgi:4-alpha-glucanotransferase